MDRIFKYEVPMEGAFSLELSRSSKILSVAEQYNKAQIWVLVTEDVLETRWFRVFGTGHIVENYGHELVFIGTFQLNGGTFIGHLFEERR